MLYRATDIWYDIGEMDTVLFFQSTRSSSWNAKLTGAYRYARERDWLLQVVPYSAKPDDIRRSLETWNPVGCMVDRALSNASAPDKTFKNRPTVYLDLPEGRSTRNPVLVHDSVATTRMGVEELLSLKLASYAFIPYGNYPWDRERRDAFSAEMKKSGLCHRVFDGDNLEGFLASLPLPCGILASNDSAAVDAMNVARRLKLNIPADLAFVGIDNSEVICEGQNPTLTSVLPDFEGAGYRLAELLDMEIRRRGSAPKRSFYGPLRVVRRGSTSVLVKSDPRVLRALEHIRLHATSRGISLDAVAKAMGCSRRLATLRFKAATGMTISDAIVEKRIEKAMTLLRDPWRTLGSIANFCGYESESYMKKIFKRKTGMTMRRWRLANAANPPR